MYANVIVYAFVVLERECFVVRCFTLAPWWPDLGYCLAR